MSLYVGRSDSRMDKKLKLLIISAIRFLASLICSGVEGMGLGLLYTGNLFMGLVSFFCGCACKELFLHCTRCFKKCIDLWDDFCYNRKRA